MEASPAETAGEPRRAPRRSGPTVVLALAVLGGLAIAGAEPLTIASVDVQTPSAAGERITGACEVINDSNPELAERCELSGFERHGGALLLLGALAVAMGLGATRGRSRPAALALAAVGLIVLGIGLLRDLPETSETGAIGTNFEGAVASAEIGLYLEIAGGALCVLAAVGALMVRGRSGDRDETVALGH